MMVNMFYRFEDGYFCWYAGKLKGLERKVEIMKHGKIVEERVA